MIALPLIQKRHETSFDEGKELGASCQVQMFKMLGSCAHFEHEINQESLSRPVLQYIHGGLALVNGLYVGTILDEQLDDEGSFLIGRGKLRVLNIGIVAPNQKVLARNHQGSLAANT